MESPKPPPTSTSPPPAPSTLRRPSRRSWRVNEAIFVAGAAKSSDLPAAACPEFAFAGRSNVGKSTLLNAMMERRGLVRTSRTPGCTRQINLFEARLADATFILADLPGYGFAKRSKGERAGWGVLLEGYLADRRGLDALVVLLDVRRGVEPDDLELIAFYRSVRGADARIVAFATKTDKLGKSERKPALAKIERRLRPEHVRVVGVSGATGEGREEAWEQLAEAARPPPEAGAAPEDAAR